ncbi:PLP-dependent aminotransferase family protein [Acetobacteraceae bacterium H6797]|nr:PLP-dependent aminotransferase family protein [Acetobacteraceae bacterium H6797]
MDYRAIADQIASDIETKRLEPGARLPPQREFAYRKGIAVSTAARVYAELTRRGLIVGEVGRGSFVRANPAAPILGEHAPGMIDFEVNFPILPEQSTHLGEILGSIASQPSLLAAALANNDPFGFPALRDAVERHFAWDDFRADPSRLLFAGNGRQGIAAAFSALSQPGARIGFEALTYPVARAIAQRLGFVPVPLAMDEHGLVPEALEAAHRAERLSALYIQPTLHNPLGTTMPLSRRQAIAKMLGKLNLTAVEDSVYGFLAADAPPPVAALAPDHVILIDSLSKRMSPGATVGLMLAPSGLRARLAASLRSGGWMASAMSMVVSQHLLDRGLLASLEQAKRADARRRQSIAREILTGLSVVASPEAYHLWLELPEPWRAESYVAAAARRGIAIWAGAAFSVSPAHAPAAVRIALAAPPEERIAEGLRSLADLARSGGEGSALPE